MRYKIALVVTYFGELPFWYPAFQLSCSYNPSITWIIFSDQVAPKDCPHNVKFINITINDFLRLITDNLKIDVTISPDYLYKICDYKPAFGLIYQEYLFDYDFWGHCDLDIVWGRICHFITEDILSSSEIISSRPSRISGHFCLYKNIDKINRMFISMPFTKKMLLVSDKCVQLDEDYFSRYLHWLIAPTFPSRIKQFFFGKPYIPKISWDRTLTTSGEQQRQLISKPGGYLRWKDGSVYNRDGKELMYLHFHLLKKTIKSIDFDCVNHPTEFLITPSQITIAGKRTD